MNPKRGLALLGMAFGVAIVIGSFTGNLAAMLASLIDSSDLTRPVNSTYSPSLLPAIPKPSSGGSSSETPPPEETPPPVDVVP